MSDKQITEPLLQPGKKKGSDKSKVQVSFENQSEAKEPKTKSSPLNTALKPKSSIVSMKDQKKDSKPQPKDIKPKVN